MKNLLNTRYYLEIVSVPIFIFLTLHLINIFLSSFGSFSHDHDHSHDNFFSIIVDFFSLQNLLAILILGLFVNVWHNPKMKNFVPCSHSVCTHKEKIGHFLASLAFIFHLFPESIIRYQIISDFQTGDFLIILASVGFLTHFLIDIIIVFLLSSFFWRKNFQKLVSFFIFFIFWLFSLWVGKNGGMNLGNSLEPVLFLISAFLLSMFIHKPHK